MRRWIELFVVEHNICPFAKRVLVKNRIRFIVTASVTQEELVIALQEELELLVNDETIETSLIIHPYVLQNFHDYNDFINHADNLLVAMRLEGIFQIASFHPDYQFNGAGPEDTENYTNRSPYPMLHLLREDMLERAIENYPDVDLIPVQNIKLMNSMGQHKLNEILQKCVKGK